MPELIEEKSARIIMKLMMSAAMEYAFVKDHYKRAHC